MTDSPKRKRAPGAGRKRLYDEAKVDGNIALTPSVRAVLKQMGPSIGEAIERLVRRTKEFKAAQKEQNSNAGKQT